MLIISANGQSSVPFIRTGSRHPSDNDNCNKNKCQFHFDEQKKKQQKQFQIAFHSLFIVYINDTHNELNWNVRLCLRFGNSIFREHFSQVVVDAS